LGEGQFMVDPNGKSAVSFEDFSIALLDEIETPKHLKDRFAIAY
jgi:putative NADH-flavin reductase